MRKKVLSVLFIVSILICSFCSVSFAQNDNNTYDVEIEYSDVYKRYLELSDEEKSKIEATPMPGNYIRQNKGIKNPITAMATVGASTDPSFNLQSVIPENIVVKDQKTLDICWAFASLSSLETNLAISDIRNGNEKKVYDFSERHMDYGNVRNFLNDKVNNYGQSRTPGSSANWYTALSYLTNGMGAVVESDWPFDQSTDAQDISKLNKNVVTQVNNANVYLSQDKESISAIIKKDLELHGSIGAYIYGAQLNSDYYNPLTGAIYCDVNQPDHAVSIIGWDDNYDVSKFNANHRPTNPGAWIIKNSWGSEVGNNGIMYVSYEDANIYYALFEITDASNEKIDKNIYLYDETGHGATLKFTNMQKFYIGDIYNKKTSGEEYITQVSIYNPEPYTCRVFINANGSSMKKDDLTLATVSGGEESVVLAEPGYHTIYLKDPVKINSTDEFAVVLEVTGSTTTTRIAAETKAVPGDTSYSTVNIESNKCFLANEEDFNSNTWIDLSKINDTITSYPNMDSTLKVFTSSNVDEKELDRIEITKLPEKTVYKEGENFDNTGMEVTAYYTDETQKIIDYYEIKNGTGLTTEQNSVTIAYMEKTAFVPISVLESEGPSDQNSIPENVVPQNEVPVNEIPTNEIPANEVPANEVPQNEIHGGGGEEPTERTPQNSDLSNITCDLKTINLNDNEASMTILIKNFKQNKENDSLTYYYCLSGDSNADTSNLDFVLIKNPKVSGNTLEFDIDSRDLQNVSGLDNADSIYIYLMEVASAGGNQATVVSKGIQLDVSETTTIEYTSPEGEVIRTSASEIFGDSTVATRSIPQTGMSSMIIVLLGIAFVVGATGFAVYKKTQRNIKGK